MKNFIIACQFLTRITLDSSIEVSSEEMATSTAAYPGVGFVVGVILTITYLLLSQLRALPGLTVAILLTIGEILITGGLHLDGFMDCADGLFSYRPKEKILAIMKDSAVGANAVIALVSLLLVKIALLLVLLPDYFWLLLLTPLVSRWTILDLAVFFPYAGQEGSLGGTVIGQAGLREFCRGTISALVLSTLIALFAWKMGSQSLSLVIIVLLTAWLAGFITARWVARGTVAKIGGVTGDVLGAALELGEVAVLLAIVVLTSLFV